MAVADLIQGPYFWLIVAAIGISNFVLRSAFVFAIEHIRMTDTLRTILAYIPASVLAALVAPAILLHQGTFDFPLHLLDGKERLIAGLIALIAAFWKRNLVWTMVAGMGALYVLEAFFA